MDGKTVAMLLAINIRTIDVTREIIMLVRKPVKTQKDAERIDHLDMVLRNLSVDARKWMLSLE